MPINNKVKQLYDAMKADGADVGTEQEFSDYFFAKGDQGYKNRKAVYDAFKADGADVGENYEEFAGWLGLQAATPKQKPVQQPVVQRKPTPTEPVQQKAQPQPTQLPEGFGMLDLGQTQQMGIGKGPVSWEQPQQTAEEKNPAKQLDRALKGDKKAAQESGLNAAAKRMQDELAYTQATGKGLGEGNKYAQWEAPTLSQDENGQMLTGVTTDEQRAGQYQQQMRDVARREMDDAISKAIAYADDGLETRTLQAIEESEMERDENPLMFALSHMSPQSSNMYQQGQERLLNRGISPEALWESVNYNGFIDKLLKDDELVSRAAQAEGMSKEEYAQNVLLPKIAEHYDKYLTDKFDIKGFGDYLVQRAMGSMTGNILSGAVQTKGQQQMRGAAVERAHEGFGTYKPGIAGRLAGEVAMFAPDAPELMMTGVFGQQAAKAVGGGLAMLGNKLKSEGLATFGRLAAEGSPFLAANVGRATKWGGLAMNRAIAGTGLGAFMGGSAAVQEMNTGDGSLSNIGKAFAKGFGEGALTGAVLGVTNLGAQTGASAIAGNSLKAKAARAGLFGTAFVAENQLFANMDRFREEDYDWVDSTMDAFYMQLASKMSSGHSMAESMKGVSRLFSGKAFSEKPKSGLSWQSDGFRLNDSERSEIEKAFAGTKLTDIAANPENVGKILGDKQNISWMTRQKVAGSMGMLEPTRPRTARINITPNKEVVERGADGELIEVHKFETPEQMAQIKQQIEERRANEDMLADFGKLSTMQMPDVTQEAVDASAAEIMQMYPDLRPEDVQPGGKSYDMVLDHAKEINNPARQTISQFAQEYGMTDKEVVDIMNKKPIERTDEEYDLMTDLAARLHEAAYPKGEPHQVQSRIDGENLAGEEPMMNPETAASIAQEVNEARNAYLSAPISDEVREGINSLGPDARLDDIYMYVRENYSGPEVDNYLEKLADFANAKAKQQGFIEKTGANIDETVNQDVIEKSFHGTIDDAPDDGNIITINKDGEDYVLINGNLGTRDGIAVDPEKSGGQIIARTQDGRWEVMKPDALMTISSREPKDVYADRVREELQLQDTNTAIETGLVEQPKPEGEAKPTEGNETGGIQDNAGGEAGATTGTGANEPSATAISKIPTLKDGEGKEILDDEGDPQYQWDKAPLGDTLAALSEINHGDMKRVSDTVDAMIKAAEKEVKAAEKLTPKSSDPIKRAREQDKIDAQKSEAQAKVDYWTQAKQELEKANKPETNLNVAPVEDNEPKNDVTLQPKAASEQPEGEKKPTLKSRLQQLAERYKKKYGSYFNDDISVPGDATELVALNIGTGRQFRWEDKPNGVGGVIRGFRTALGIDTEFGGRRGSEGHAFAHLFKGKDDTTGLGFDEFVDKVWRSDENTIHGLDGEDRKRFTEQQIGDALIDLFMSAESGKDITEYVLRNRVEKAQKAWEAEQESLKQKEEVKLTDEEIEKAMSNLPFHQSTDEDIPDAPITKLYKEAKAIMEEEGTPEIEIHDTDRMQDNDWEKLTQDIYDGAFIDDKLVEETKGHILEQKVFYDEETGKIKVFSSDLTPEELRNHVEQIKRELYDRNNDVRREEKEDILPARDENGDSRLPEEKTGEGGDDGQGEERPESSGEPERKPESSERDGYLKPRNEKEEKIVSDVEAKLAEDIKAAEEEVRKAKSELEKATDKEGERATDLFADDNAFKKEGQLFGFEEMPVDRSKEGVERRTEEERENLMAAEAKLENLQSEAEHDSRVRAALDNERRQTSFDPMETIEEQAKEFQKEEDKQMGVTRNETPEQVSETEGDVIINDEPPLTEEEIDSSSLSDVQKTWAKAYLKGLQDNELYTNAYLEAYEDVRNRRQDDEANRSDADGTQLAGPDDREERGSGRTGEQTGSVAAGGDVPRQDEGNLERGRVSGVEDSQGDISSTDGERSNNDVPGSESEVDGLPAGGDNTVGGGRTGGNGRNVRAEGESRRGSGVAGQTGERDIKTKRSELKSKRDELLARLKELKDKEKKNNSGKLMMAILPPAPSGIDSFIPKDKEQRKVFWELATTTAEYGYTYLEEGITKFNEWKDKVYEDFVEPIKDFFGWGQNEVDRYIQQVWNSDYNINGVTRTMAEWASFIGEKELKKIVATDRSTKFEQQKAAENIAVKTGDIENIRETLPYLLPEQQDDVLKAETQFFDETHQDREHGNGKGMMFTNGTGTGKTYTGLGIVKRFVKQGKGRVLILTPSQEKVTDWRNDGRNLGLDIESLDEEAKNKGTSATKAKGKGVVVTTYANARQNLAMLEDCFDLIVYDESHKIMESKEATNTTMMDFHEMLTNKNVERSIDRQTYWLPEWVEHRNLLKEREDTREKLDTLDNYDDSEEITVNGEKVIAGELKAKFNARMLEIERRLEELRPIMQEIRESKRPQAEIDSKRTKTVFLSATPFNVRESLRYAEGYLFSFPEEDKNTIGTYNHRSPEDAFFEQMFPAGYRWRYGRLENHVANAEALGRQEIDFSDYLQNTLGTMSGRMIASDYDYSRDFPVMTLDHAGRFNQAMSEVYRNKRYQPLAEAFRKAFDYNYSTALFEAMKTSLVNERIKEHLARGQKVVVFHRRRTSGDLEPPFRRALDLAEVMASNEQDQQTKSNIRSAIAAFETDFADMLEWEKTIDYTLPREQIERRFGKDKVAFFSGAETKKTKHQSVEEFMKDNGGKDIIVIQEASGKEGISLHDQTGKHQRVEINLALPQSPIAFIQIEGRIYRIGQKSNAIFEYPLLGLDLETNLFAQKFNSALGTTENLALGSKARNLRKSIANSVLENTGEVDYDRQGLGGKDMDGRVADSSGKDGFDTAIQDYYGNQKMKRGRDNREGIDYFPTPEPIGYKMVEWGQLMDGETALEPSAGHGAIARYVPETNGMTAIEPSAGLFTKLQMRAGGSGRRFEEMNFEDYPLANKHDAILMNPPYGVGGKTAMEHVAKAFRHLNEGGRIVAIIPDGPAMEKRLDAWLSSGETNGAAVVTGEVKLPDVAFGRAGTSVRTRVVVIDKVSRAEMRRNMPDRVSVDLSGEQSIGGLFDRIRNIRMPERTIDQAAINEKRAKRTERQLNDNPMVNNVFIGQDRFGNTYLRVSAKGNTDLDMNFDLANVSQDDILYKYEKLKKYRDNPEKYYYGKYIGKSFGSGKNKVPALDAIRDYCETAIKALENISRMTADQMDKAVRERQEAIERRRREVEEEWKRDRERREQERIEKFKQARETLSTELGDREGKEWIEEQMEDAWSSMSYISVPARRRLSNMGIDWETGHVENKNEPVNARTATVVQPQSTQRKADYEYALDKNTRTGQDMHLVKYNGERLSDADYRATERKAKALNGYYNRFKKAWHFNTETDAKKFAESLNTSSSNDGAVRFSEKKNQEKLNNRGEDIESEKKDVSLPKNKISYEETDRERVFAGNEAVMRTVAEASDDGIRDSATKEDGRGSGSKESVLRSLVQRAQENGTWRDSIDDEVIGYIGEGRENIVYLSKDGQHVIKLNNFKYVPDGASDLSAFVDRLRAHNELFPADSMELIGFTETPKGEVAAIIRQPLVDAEREATDKEIDDYLEDHDFSVDMTDEWSDGKYGVLDLKSDNVLVDKNGHLRFVDVIVRDMDRQKKRTRFKEGDGLEEQHSQEVLKDAEKLAKKLGSPVKVATHIDEVSNKEAAEAIREGRQIQGWYDTETGEVTLYLPNIGSTHEGEKVVAHETIGHKGLRALLGENGYKSYMRSLALDLKNEELSKYISENLAKNDFDMYRTIDEFLAEAAEKGYGDLSFWQKVKETFTDALRKVGFTMSPSISDVKYMVWLSKHNLEKGNVMDKVQREALLYKLGKERYEAKVRNGEFGYEEPKGESYTPPYFPGEGKTLFRHTPSVKNQRQNYERALKRMGYVWKEAHIDAMQSAVELMRSISGVKKIEDIPSAENFVLLENQMSSKEEQMDFLFNRDYMEPLDKAVARCLPDMGKDVDKQLRNLQLYMIKKHGLERNRVLFVRDAIRALRKDSSADQKQVDQLEQDYNDMMTNLRDDLKNGIIDLREYHENVDAWIKSNIDPKYKPGEKDYSGLTSLYGKGYNESDVIDEVMGTEDMLGKDRVDNLWDKTNAVSQFGLDMEYEGGLDSKEKHDKVSQMFEWYVPLRGYDEKTAEEVYDYLEEHGNDRKWAGPVLMNAGGRESLADVDVFATLGAMSSSAINRALRNQMKQAFARFVRNHYNDVDADKRLVTELPAVWAEKQYDPTTGAEVWVEKFPDIPEDAKADDVAAILDQYQQDMKAKEATGDAKRVRQNSSIPFRPADKEHKAQHIVDVWINGEKHSFVVNGNPRAAQAVNGQLKAERNSNILWLSSLSHFMAKMNTSYSPDFIMRNTERDLIYSAANIAVKENYKYWLRWAKNYVVAMGRVAAGVPAMHTNLFKRYREGNLNMRNTTDRYFKEFMENGGETGWVERKNLDKWKKAIKNGVKADSKPEEVGKAIINALPDAIEAMNERAENLARFATYMTSREMGRSVTRSVSDAKEVSVNFNRKGAGKKTVGLNKGDNSWLNNANAYMAGWSAQNLQDYIMFYNAGVQGMTNMIKNVANHPIKGSAAFAVFALAGMLMPQLNQFLAEEDDDKTGNEPENPYAELPEYVRRNNLCIYADNGKFITIALPIELRAMYGIGDMAASYINHPELRSTKNMGEDIVTQLSQVAPLDFFGEGAGPLWAVVPSGVRPFAEAAANKNWLGQPIERDEERWNENKPRWVRAFKNVGDAYVGASKWLNAKTNPYHDEEIKGWADGAVTDPALFEHIVNGYFGGVGSTVNRVAQLAKHADEMSPKEAITSNWMPIVRTQHYSPNERTRYARTRNKWWYYKEEADNTMETIKVLKKRGHHDPVAFMQSVSEEEGKKGTRAKIMEKAYKSYTKVKKKMEKTDDLQQMNIYQLQMDQIMEGAVKELDKIQ